MIFAIGEIKALSERQRLIIPYEEKNAFLGMSFFYLTNETESPEYYFRCPMFNREHKKDKPLVKIHADIRDYKKPTIGE